MPLSTPDITKAQAISAVTALFAAALVLFKLNLTDAQQAAVVTIIGTVVPIVWTIADALIRRARAHAVAATAAAAAATAAVVAAPLEPAVILPRKKKARPRAPKNEDQA